MSEAVDTGAVQAFRDLMASSGWAVDHEDDDDGLFVTLRQGRYLVSGDRDDGDVVWRLIGPDAWGNCAELAAGVNTAELAHARVLERLQRQPEHADKPPVVELIFGVTGEVVGARFYKQKQEAEDERTDRNTDR